MKHWIILLMLMTLVGCKAPAPSEESDGGEKPNETFWQLQDDSELSVAIKPWPPEGGRATLEAQASLGDDGGSKPIVESLEYRVSKSQSSSDAWTPMTRSETQVQIDGEGSVTEYKFTATEVALPTGKVFVQFRAKGSKLDQELPDWSVTIP